MFRIAVVEDEQEHSDNLVRLLNKFAEEEKILIDIATFKSGVDFLSIYKCDFDIVFLDIVMPGFNGLETAKQIRRQDDAVTIIFITTMANYAINGYEVNALDFIVKPVDYESFNLKLKKAFRYSSEHREKEVVVHTETNCVKLKSSEIYFIEKDKNYTVFHTVTGIYKQRGTLSDIEKELQGSGFSRCTSGCLVNLKYVKNIHKSDVQVNDEVLAISRGQHKKFYSDVMAYFSGR